MSDIILITIQDFASYVQEAADELIDMIDSYHYRDCIDEDSLFVRTIDNLENFYKIKTSENGIILEWVTDYWNEPSIQSIVEEFEERVWKASR